MKSVLPSNYQQLVQELKEKIRRSKIQAARLVNREMLLVYWEIGKVIAELEKEKGWGAKIVDKMALDLKLEFPAMKGLSPRSLRYMKELYVEYPRFSTSAILQPDAAKSVSKKSRGKSQILQPAAAKLSPQELIQKIVDQIPWTYHQVLFDKVKSIEERLFYMQKAVENNWSRNVLSFQIDNNLFVYCFAKHPVKRSSGLL